MRRLAVGLLLLSEPLAAADDFIVRTTPEWRVHEFAVLRLARAVHRELVETLGLPSPMSHGPVEIELGLGEPPPDGAGHAVVRGPSGVFGLVRLGDPRVLDRDETAFALAAALVRAAIHNRARGPEAVTEPPVWFIRGVARQADPSLRGADFEAAYARWSGGRLPGAAELWQARRSPAAQHLDVASQLAAWCASRPDRQQRWQAWCEHLAQGGAWTPGALASIWFDDDDLARLDAAWDAWLVVRTRRVFDPGTTPAGVRRRFQSQLLLYPWECVIYIPAVALGGTPLVWCIENPDSPGVRQAAAAKSRHLLLQGAGRDPAFREMAAGYADVMRRLAAGASRRELRSRWRQAEAQRLALEAERTAPPRNE